MIRLDAVTLRQLRALASIAETGSITSAAQQLGLSPPAVHSQIRNLETALETTLLRRSSASAGSDLTPEAGVVLEAARRMDIALRQAAEELGALHRGSAGRVTLGVVSTGKYYAPRLVARLRQLCPDIEIALRVANREGTIADLERHAVDLAIMGRPPRMPEVAAAVLGPHPHGLIAPPDHPLAGRDEVSIADLLQERMITREEGSGTRILMTRYLDSAAGGRIFDLVEMGSNETIKQAVMAGLGLAFLSLHTAMEELHQGRLVQLAAPGLPITRQWFLVHPASRPLTPAAQTIHDRILGLKGSFLPS